MAGAKDTCIYNFDKYRPVSLRSGDKEIGAVGRTENITVGHTPLPKTHQYFSPHMTKLSSFPWHIKVLQYMAPEAS